jgi:hypothetical protein
MQFPSSIYTRLEAHGSTNTIHKVESALYPLPAKHAVLMFYLHPTGSTRQYSHCTQMCLHLLTSIYTQLEPYHSTDMVHTRDSSLFHIHSSMSIRDLMTRRKVESKISETKEWHLQVQAHHSRDIVQKMGMTSSLYQLPAKLTKCKPDHSTNIVHKMESSLYQLPAKLTKCKPNHSTNIVHKMESSLYQLPAKHAVPIFYQHPTKGTPQHEHCTQDGELSPSLTQVNEH